MGCQCHTYEHIRIKQLGVTKPQRSKEESSDYRYFPDPDLVPVKVTPDQVETVRSSLAKLPAQIRTELEDEFKLSAYDADVIVNQGPNLVAYFKTVVENCNDAFSALRRVQ